MRKILHHLFLDRDFIKGREKLETLDVDFLLHCWGVEFWSIMGVWPASPPQAVRRVRPGPPAPRGGESVRERERVQKKTPQAVLRVSLGPPGAWAPMDRDARLDLPLSC